ncbi:hypothetical protein V1477_008235, partial [Vespula maculifrons]
VLTAYGFRCTRPPSLRVYHAASTKFSHKSGGIERGGEEGGGGGRGGKNEEVRKRSEESRHVVFVYPFMVAGRSRRIGTRRTMRHVRDGYLSGTFLLPSCYHLTNFLVLNRDLYATRTPIMRTEASTNICFVDESLVQNLNISKLRVDRKKEILSKERVTARCNLPVEMTTNR